MTDNIVNRLTLDETEELLRDIVNYDIEYRSIIDTNPEPSPLDQNEPVCGAGVDSMCVAGNGEFYPCSGFHGYPLGNAHELSVSEVWHNSEAHKRLRAVNWRNFPECMRCEAKPYCAMCMVRNMNETGSIFTVSKHFCDTAFLNVERYYFSSTSTENISFRYVRREIEELVSCSEGRAVPFLWVSPGMLKYSRDLSAYFFRTHARQ